MPIGADLSKNYQAMDKPQVPKEFCRQILDLDNTIRFAGVSDTEGKLIVKECRKGIVPLLSKEEEESSLRQASIRMASRKALEPKIGKTIYAFAFYEKVKRATIPLGGDLILLVSFDIQADYEPIILIKIIPLAKKHRLIPSYLFK